CYTRPAGQPRAGCSDRAFSALCARRWGLEVRAPARDTVTTWSRFIVTVPTAHGPPGDREPTSRSEGGRATERRRGRQSRRQLGRDWRPRLRSVALPPSLREVGSRSPGGP